MEKVLRHLTRKEYDDIRQKFIVFADSQGWRTGNDEFGYHDDDEEASAAWCDFFAREKKRILSNANT